METYVMACQISTRSSKTPSKVDFRLGCSPLLLPRYLLWCIVASALRKLILLHSRGGST